MKKGAKRKATKAAGKRSAPTGAQATTPTAKAGVDRRALLGWLKVGGVAAVIFGGVGYYAVSSTVATLNEQDLSRIGQGTPAVVQIHDPGCPQCAALQRETRAALAELEPDALEYVVANMNTPEGARYARLHGVGHVTLLLVDGQGEVQRVITGVQDRARLAASFATHAASAAPDR
ncbi:MAG: hypothetical protein AAF698_07340 [Pseudomonadota bacterium]